MLFVAQYQCSDPSLKETERFHLARRRAIEQQVELQLIVDSKSDDYTNSVAMNALEYSEDVEERFADRMGLEVFGRLLNDSKLGTLQERRDLFFSNVAFSCITPDSPAARMALEMAEKRVSLETHDVNRLRLWSQFTPKIRERLGCQVDPTLKYHSECPL